MPSAVPTSTASNPTNSSQRPTRATASLRAAVILSGLYFLARFLGLFQGALISSMLPPTAADAYSVAFDLPDFLNYVVAGGALSLTFIPIFTGFWDRGKEAAAWRFFSSLACLMGSVLILATLVMFVFTPQLTAWTKPGLMAPGKAKTFDLAVAMTRIMLPAQLCFYLGGLLNGVLNSFKRFGASGWTGAIYNLVAIIIAVPLWKVTNNPLMFAWGILVGAFTGNFLMPLLALRFGPRQHRPRFRFRFDPNSPSIRRFFKLALPIMLGVSFPVVDYWIVGYFTSGMDTGSLTHMRNGNRLMIAVQGILGQAAAVAAFPFLVSIWTRGDYVAFAEYLRSGLRRLLFLTLPISVLLMLCSHPIVSLIYGWGEFNVPHKISETASAFCFYSVGLFAWAAQGLVARGFYAAGDTKTPTIFGTLLTVVFVGLCALLKPIFGLAGLAFATSIGAIIQFAGLLVFLDNRLSGPQYQAPIGLIRIAGTLLRTIMACALMGLAGVMATRLIGDNWVEGKVGDIGMILWVGGISSFVFAAAATRFDIPEWHWIRTKLRRR